MAHEQAVTSPNWFEAGEHVRIEARRRDVEWLAARDNDPRTRYVPVWRNRSLVGAGEALLVTAEELGDLEVHVQSRVLLGERDGSAIFGIELDAGQEQAGSWLKNLGRLADLREVAGELDRASAAVLAHARAMAFWHKQHRYCGACGAPTEAREGGHVRACLGESCGKSHFPRTDPAVIVLVAREDRCLLGRSNGWPPGLFSTVAGFVEPGESIEDAVRREVAEETGIVIGAVDYQSSQPWPFPSSLMLGFQAHALTTEITIDPHEIEDAAWFNRDELVEQTLAGTLKLPRGVSIARRLLDEWFDECGISLAERLGVAG
jgi:NAD+ diphosphatase